jgi:hypothetical protein
VTQDEVNDIVQILIEVAPAEGLEQILTLLMERFPDFDWSLEDDDKQRTD